MSRLRKSATGVGAVRGPRAAFEQTCMMCVMLLYIKIRLLCLVVLFKSPKQSAARPERLSSRSKIDLHPQNRRFAQCDMCMCMHTYRSAVQRV